MQVVIEISKDTFERLKDGKVMNGSATAKMLINAVANGTPLPKGHGRLIDADYITKDMNTFMDSFRCNVAFGKKSEVFCIAPTIIEADKERGE